MKYEIIQQDSGKVIKKTANGIETWIPMIEGNSDYEQYLKSLDETPTL